MNPNTQQQPSVQSVQAIEPLAPPEPQKSFSWFKWVLISIVTVLLLSGVAYLIIQQLQQKQTLPQTTQAVPSTTPDETANWKTYTNTKYNYQIKYPPKWQLFETSSEVDYNSLYPPEFNLAEALKNPSDELLFASAPIITIEVKSIPLSSYPTGNRSEQGVPFITDWKAVTVNGENGIYYQMHQCAPQCSATTVLPLGQGTIKISISTVAQDKGYTPIYNQILSTLKFAGQTNEGSIKDLVMNFYAAFGSEDGRTLFGYITIPATPQEKGEYSWLTGADLGKDAFYRAFLRVKLQNPSIKSIGKVDDKTFEVKAKDEFLNYSQATGQWSTTLRDVKFSVVNTSSGWLIDKFIWDSKQGSYKGSEKYSGFPNVESN